MRKEKRNLRVEVDVEIAEFVDVRPNAKQTVLLPVEALDLVKPWRLGEITLHRVARSDSDQLQSSLPVEKNRLASNHGTCSEGRPLDLSQSAGRARSIVIIEDMRRQYTE